MQEFRHGEDWWLRRDDGSWLKWNSDTLAWEPRSEPPPEGLTEVPPGTANGSSTAETEPPSVWRARRRQAYLNLARQFDKASTVTFVILLVVVVIIVFLVFQFLDMMWNIG